MQAGVPRLIASLWAVQDRATADLMRRFYEHLLRDGGPTPAAALRAAQLDMLRDPRWSSPRFWAAFELHGDWR
jgi:CHAT domain-containing protein